MTLDHKKSPKKILIVDDEYAIRILLKTFFESHHYIVQIADDIENAFQIFCKFKPDLVISDIMMPIANGLSLISRIRGLSPAIKVIYLSAWIDESETELKLKQELLQHPDYKMIQKPFHLDTFLTVVQNYLEE
jgi:two-component system response regulator (stage 0 sporulation protein F)